MDPPPQHSSQCRTVLCGFWAGSNSSAAAILPQARRASLGGADRLAVVALVVSCHRATTGRWRPDRKLLLPAIGLGKRLLSRYPQGWLEVAECRRAYD